MRKLTKEQKRQIATVAGKEDADIDLSEMPEVVDWSGAEMGKFYRPAKKPVTMRLDADVVDWLKSYGRGYQTRANSLLRHAMESTREAGRKRKSA
ncbi:MAG TPA: BrnA antitoxin family protein [Acidobacteriaceae bacterium]|nr:BrnA antitoxin family protein [Acidobacteriaceae bacterium]